MEPRIRPIALCLIKKGNSLLLEKCFDDATGVTFYRPLGGGIEFGEPAADAAVRELREEIGEKICNVTLAGVFENIFAYRNKPSHEVVFLFRAEFENPAAWEKEEFVVVENYGNSLASWVPVDEFIEARCILYPQNILEFLPA